MKELTLPTVQRIRTARGSHVEPELDQNWDEATKLAWWAASVSHDTGIHIRLWDEAWIVHGTPIPGNYAITLNHTKSRSALNYRDMWAYLTGIETGYEIATGRQS